MGSTAEITGVIQLRSRHSVSVTIDRLEGLLQERGVLVFARIDFSGDATRSGLSLLPEQMLIFGNPKGGTPLLQQAATVGLDLPLKALVWEDEQGTTWVGYNTTDYIIQRHGLPSAMSANLAGAITLLQQMSEPS